VKLVKIFANPEYREVIQAKLAEFKQLLSKLERQTTDTKNELPSNPNRY
jgi:hypothetical protein